MSQSREPTAFQAAGSFYLRQMADDKLIFPVHFDLEAAVKDAQKDAGAAMKSLEDVFNRNAIALKVDASGITDLGKSLNNLIATLTRLNNILSDSSGATAAQQQLNRAIEEQGAAVASVSGSMTRHQTEQEKVNKALRDTYVEQEKVNRLITQYHDTYEGQIDSLARLNSQLAANKKAQSDNEKALSHGRMSAAAYAKAHAELTMQARQLTQEKRLLTQIMTAEEKAMMAQEGSYNQLSQQLSLLKKAFKDLSDEGRASQFGQELSTAIQALDVQLKGMAADMGEFQRNVGNYAIAGQNGVVATESLVAAMSQEARTIQDLIDQTRILEEAKRMINKEDANYQSTLTALNSKLDENRRKLADVSDIVGREAKTVAEAEAQNKRLAEAIKHIDLSSVDAKKQLEAMRSQIERNNKTISAATGANERYADSVLGLVGLNANFGRSFQGLAQGGNLMDGLKVKAQALGKTLLGLISNPYVLAFIGVAGVVAGFKWWYDYNKGLIEASRLTENFTGLSGEAADKVTADMQALADHMGKGYKETISAANVLVQQFGVSWGDAMKLMQDGIIAGADMSGNMVSNVERFAPALRDAGVSADEFMSILAETRNGVFNEQGLQDIVKGGTRLRAMTKQIAESLDAVGISSEKMQKDLTDGTITMFDAVQQVATKLKELPENSQEAGNIMRHVFGRVAAEGGTLLIQSIADVNTNLDEAKKRMGELGEANEAQMNAQRELNETLSAVFKMSGTSFEGMLANAKTFVLEGLNKIIHGCVDVVNWFIRMYNKSMVVRAGVGSIVNSFQTLWEISKFVVNQIIDSFTAAGTILEGVVTLDWDKVKEGYANGMKALGNNISTLAKNIASNTADTFKNTLNGEMKEVSLNLNTGGINTNQSKKKGGKDKEITPITDPDKGKNEAAKTYLQTLNKIEQSITAINTKYNEFVKKEGNAKAVEHINKLYKQQLDYINELARQFGLSFDMPTSFKSLQDARSAILGVIEKLKASGLKGAANAALDLDMKIGLGNVDSVSHDLERNLTALSERVSRTKAAKEFYDKILSQTGSASIASNVTLSIYGDTGEGLQKQIVEQIQRYFSGVDIELPINLATGDVDYKALREIWDADKLLPAEFRQIPAQYDSVIKQILDNGDNFNKKQAEQWLNDLQAAQSYADKRIELARYTATQIEAIEKKRDALDPTDSNYEAYRQMYDRQIAGYKVREEKEAASIEFDAFKEMPLYTSMFADLDKASISMLTNMREQLEQMKGSWRNLDPTQIKELQDRINDIDGQLAARNPFKALSDAFKEYKELSKNGTKAEADKAFLDATKKYADAKAELEKLLAEKPTDDPAVEEARQLVNSTEEAARKAQELAERWAKVEKAIGLSSSQIFAILGSFSDIAGGIGKLTQVFGGDEEDVQYWNDIADGLSEVTSGIENMVQAAMSGNPIGVVTSAITAIPNMISGFANLFSAGKVKKANKEIKRQQKILEQLEYTYDRLNSAADKALGADFVANQKQQHKILLAQQQAYMKQYEAEMSKGKKKDQAKADEYLKHAREIGDQIADMEGKVAERMLGTDLTSAARDFAKSWLDAYKTFGNTADAMSQKFQELMQNMIVESLLAKVMERALKPAFDMIDGMSEADFYNESFWKRLNETAKQGAENADHGAGVVMKWIESMGINVREMTGSEHTGIAKSVAGATSEEINAVALGLNTQNAYMMFIHTDVAAIRSILQSGYAATPNVTDNAASTALTPYQTTALANYQAIQNNTAQTVAQLQIAVRELQATNEKLGRVITPTGSSSSFVIHTRLH